MDARCHHVAGRRSKAQLLHTFMQFTLNTAPFRLDSACFGCQNDNFIHQFDRDSDILHDKTFYMKLSDLLPVVVDEFQRQTGRFPTKTILLKLCYLSEVEYIGRSHKRLIEDDWVYYHFGPYVFDYDNALSSPTLERDTGETTEGKAFEIVRTSEDFVAPKLDFDVTRAVNHVIAEFGEKDLDELLDYVYFDTEPMLAVEVRGQTLDMSTVKPIEYYRVSERRISPGDLSKLREKYRQKGKSLNA